MKYNVDKKYLMDVFKRIICVPSPTGYYVKLNPVLEELAGELSYSITYDNKKTAYITVDGEDNSETVLFGAHADTIGMVVSHIDTEGKIHVRTLGGVNIIGAESSHVTVITRDGREYTGTLYCKTHSTHAFADARETERSEDNMMVLIDEDVSSMEDVRKLGIRNGDYIAFDPNFRMTENGYIKSRFIDDKGAIACAFAMLRYLSENKLKPKRRTVFAFPYYEELGAGGVWLPEGVTEYIAVDIGLVAPYLDGNEKSVTICAKDVNGPYDYELTSKLIECAEKAECDYAVDVFLRYSTDANAAFKAGNNIRHAAFGMAVYGSHSMERTHINGLLNTANLMLAYSLGI